MSVAVLVDLDANQLKGIAGRAVYLFENERSAHLWMVSRLQIAGEVISDGGGHRLQGCEETFGAFQMEELISAWQDGLGISESFHVYPVKATR